MAYLDPNEAFNHLRERTLEGIQEQFPLKGKKQTLVLEKFEVEDKAHPDDIRGQHAAKNSGGSYTAPVYGHMKLIDNATGKVVDQRKMRLAELPVETQRYSYILKGKEWQVDNQWQLKPGAYTRRRQNGELETWFNTSGKSPFDVVFDPATTQYHFEYGKSKLPAYPIWKAMGLSDATLEKSLGKDILEANRKARGVEGTLTKFYKSTKKADPASEEEARAHLVDTFTSSTMRPDTNKHTLGKPIDRVTGEALLLAAQKLKKVQAGGAEDDRDSLIFKDLRSAGDFAYDKLRESARQNAPKIARKLNTSNDIREIVNFSMFDKPLKSAFGSENSASQIASQINPVAMVSAAMQTTIMGQGGIQKEDRITAQAKLVDPSHLGFLDPIATPEGSKTGVSLRLPMGLRKVGKEAKIPLFNLKTNRTELVAAGEFMDSQVVLPDQVKWVGGRPVPLGSTVKLAGKANDITSGKFSDAKYVMRHSSQLFSTTSNLVPFMGNTSGNRSSMATRHIEQSISLVNREAPLVQVATGSSTPHLQTFEQVLGSQASHTSKVDGVVMAVKPDGVLVKGKDGKTHEVQLYHNFPLNDPKSMLNSTALVKPGDSVKAGQVVADTNYSKGGELALGTNLRVGYIPFKGYNFEDGVVISESAAKKMASQHMYKKDLMTSDDTIISRKKFEVHHPGVFKQSQLEHIGEDGLPKIGARVKPGDPLVLAVTPFALNERVGASAIRKNVMGTHSDRSLHWESDTEGEIVGIVRKKGGIQVQVRTVEPMQPGDKLCFDELTEVLTRRGWIPVAEVSLTDEVCCLVDGEVVYQEPEQLHHYAEGGRMYRIRSQQVDLLTTDAHRMYVMPRHAQSYALHPAKDIAGKRVRYLKSGRWQGTAVSHKVLPAMTVSAGQGGRGVRELPPYILPMPTYLMLLGAYLADGNLIDQPRSGTYGIEITKVKEPHRSRLYAALQEHGIPYTKVNHGHKVRIHSKQLLAHFSQFGKAPDKFIPSDVFDLSADQLRILFDWLIWGDGSRHPKSGYATAYHTVSPRLADDVQRLCLHIGIAANVQLTREACTQVIKGRSYQCRDRYTVRIVTTKLRPQVNHGHMRTQGGQEEGFIEQYNRPVYCVTVPGHVLYVRRNGIPVWSGNSGRHGNKGIVAAVLPDNEMPQTRDGKPIEVALNPSGIPGRMNVGQVLETVGSKIAEKTGHTYIAPSFQKDADMVAHLEAELKKHKLSDTEELVDPVTGQSLGKALVGKQHILKLVHQVDKKISVTSGMGLPGQPSKDKYDINLQPKKGQRLGSLGVYALLAHGSKAILREAQTYKGEGPDSQTNEAKKWPSQHNQVWAAMQTGAPLPTPKTTFAFKKFEDMLKGAGVNVEKKGHELILSPLTDNQIQTLAHGRVLPKPTEQLDARVDKKTGELKPRKGGLFDERLTGGHGGTKWSAIALAEPIPNPIFEMPIRSLTGLSQKDFDGILAGEKGVLPSGKVAPLGKGVLTGGAAIEKMLSSINVQKELEASTKELNAVPASRVDPVLKKVKYLRALDQLGMKANEAYVLKHLPVLPPVMRPASLMQDGNIKYADINQLYADFAQVNQKLQDPVLSKNLTDKGKADLRKNLYDGVRAITGYGIPASAQSDKKGLLQQIAGTQPKCFDGETEVLTEGGWVPFPQYNGTDALATVNLKTDTFEWQAPTDYTVQQYHGDMHVLKGGNVNLMVTPNHNHVMARCTQHKGVRTWAPWALVPSQDLLGRGNRSRLMTAARYWVGTSPSYTFGAYAVDPQAFATFVGWWVAEGWFGHGRYVYLAQSSPEGVEAIDAVVAALGLPHLRKAYAKDACTTGSVTYWRFNIPELTKWLLTNVGDGCENKRLSPTILSWSPTYLRALLDGYLRGDGDSRHKQRRKTRAKRTHYRMDPIGTRFSTASLGLLDDLQHLAVKVGLCVSPPKRIKQQCAHRLPVWRATVRGYRDVSFGEHLRVKVRPFTGLVYGPTVPNGTVVVRRGGVVCVSGNSGYFQHVVANKRQDLSMRSTIVPEPSLGLDEVGIPKAPALELFRPFIVKKLQDMGAAPTPLEAQKLLAKGDSPSVTKALEKVLAERPVLLKRDPALHKYSIQGFQPKVVDGSSIKIHPLVCGGFNADFDGDTMSMFVPVSREAVAETHKMKPTNNLFMESSGKLAYQPTLESALGIYKLSHTGKDSKKTFKNPGEALDAVRAGKLKYDQTFMMGGKKTTAGRVLLSTAVPASMQDKVLHDLGTTYDKKGLDKLLTQVGKDHTADFDRVVNKLKDLGNNAAYGSVAVPLPQNTAAQLVDPKKQVFVPIGTHSLSLADFKTDTKTRSAVLSEADKMVAKIKASHATAEEKERQTVAVYTAADTAMHQAHMKAQEKNPSNLYVMNKAGVKPDWKQYKQMVLAPMLLKDSSNRIIPTPVTKSYSEGLDTAGYWTQMHGARRGAVLKVQEVQEPGALSKMLQNNAMHLVIAGEDCGTHRGLSMSVGDKSVYDRVLAQDVNAGKVQVKAGTVLTPDLVGQIRSADKNASLVVRSPLRCTHAKGVCQHCMGIGAQGTFQDVGTNVGVAAAQTVGERAVQLTLKAFHSGGVADANKTAIDSFGRFKQLTSLPKKIPNAASLAMTTGTIERIQPTSTGAEVWIGGKKHFVGKDKTGHALYKPFGAGSEWQGIKVGQTVKAGDTLSDPTRTSLNPRDYYKAVGSIDKVQGKLADEMYRLYEGEGVRRQHIELVVKGMTNLTKVVQPGDAPNILRGELQQLSHLQQVNSDLVKQGKKPIQHTPVLQGVETMPLDVQDDWMAKLQHRRLRTTIAQGAAVGARSNLHGTHPIPGLAYGAEFGLNEDLADRPGMGHLRGIKRFNY